MLSFFSILESFLEYVFLFLYQLSHNYGYAIVLLSVFISLLLLPVYMLAERLQKKELLQRQSMQAKLDEIKQSFQGQEQFMMIQSLYRLHKYHPVLGLRSMGSLLIQIPFFFAAYHMLRDFTALEGVSFLFIEDLSKADALLPFGRYRINVLPFIMTAINIMAANVYTRRVDPKSLVSAWNIALIFFVLLYAMPSGLVLYWTCNNMFTLLKNVLLSLRLQKNKGKEESAWQIIKKKLLVFIENDIKVMKVVFFLWLFGGYLVLAYVLRLVNRLRGEVPNTLLGIAIVALVISESILLLYFYRKQIYKEKLQKTFQHDTKHYDTKNAPRMYSTSIVKHSLFFGSVVCMIIGAAMMYYYIQLPVFMINVDTVLFKLSAFSMMIIPNAVLFPYVVSVLYRLRSTGIHAKTSTMLIKRKAELRQWWYILLASSSAVILLIFLVLPAEIYKSDPVSVSVSFTAVLIYVLPYIIASIVIPMLIWICCPYRVKSYVGYIVFVLSSVVLLYALVVPFDIGGLDHFILMSPQSLLPRASIYVLEGIALICFCFWIFSFLKNSNNRKIIITVLVAVNGVFIYMLVDFGLWLQNDAVVAQVSDAQNKDKQGKKSGEVDIRNVSVPRIADRLFSFSSTKQNIVVVLLDMASGGDMQRMLDERPSIKEHLKGFIWYPNTLSISTYTGASISPMIAGWNYTPENMVILKGENLAEKVVGAYDTMFSRFKQYNYLMRMSGVSYHGGDHAQCKDLEKQNIACLDYWDDSFVSYWKQNNREQQAETDVSFSGRTIALLIMAGMLRSVPVMMKYAVYDHGNWNMSTSEFKNQEGYRYALKSWAVLDSLRSASSRLEDDRETYMPAYHGSSSTEDSAGTFTFIHSNITHQPYALDKHCMLQSEEFPDENIENNYAGNSAYFSFRCSIESLTQWFTWLQEHNVYDNTKIIIVSDHGGNGYRDYMNRNNISSELLGTDYSYMFPRAHALLLVKDFNQNNAFSIDTRLMSNVDMAAMMYHSIEGYVPPNDAHAFDKIDYAKQLVPDRTVPIYHTEFYNWAGFVREKKQFKIKNKYTVTDTIFELKNWNKVQ